jgi:hypothetical protein
MRRLAVVLAFLVTASAPCRAQILAEGVLFFDRGHYWIELTFHDAALRDTIPPGLAREAFEITKLGDAPGVFRPSKIEIVSGDGQRPIVVLSSGRFEGRSCYRVTFRPAGSAPVAIDSICDPFWATPESGECGGKAFFRDHVAAAFRRDSDTYDLNRFTYEYDFSDERSSASLSIEPRFRAHGFAFEPLFEQSRVAYTLSRSGTVSTDRRALGLAVSRAGWVKDLRLSITARYRHDRSALGFASGDSTVFTQSLVVEGRIRFDNLFDHVNRYCLSVFKGVDLGFGCTWYQSDDREVWGSAEFDRTTPFVNLRATWTFLYGFQLSYSLQSFWPLSLEDRFLEFHSVRFRLLLRDVLPAQAGKAYHPDVEIGFDTGRRLPLFAEEKKVSIGFTFGLYPW